MLLSPYRALLLAIVLLAWETVTASPLDLSSRDRLLPPIVVPMAMQPYSVNIVVGSQAIPYNVLLDSATQDLILPTANCTTDGSCTIPPGFVLYDPSLSTTPPILHDKGRPKCISYGGGGPSQSYCGWLIQDVVGLADVHVSDSMLFTGNYHSPERFKARGNANFGIGRTGADPSPFLTIPQSLYANGHIDNPSTSFYLDPALQTDGSPSPSTDDGNSFVSFGVPQSKIQNWIPAMNDSYDPSGWYLNINSIGGQTVNCKTMIDTGGPRMVFSQALGPTVYAAMGLKDYEMKYCTLGITPCIPQRLAGNTMSFTFSGSNAIFQVAGANSSSCQGGYCDSEFDLVADQEPGSAYFGVVSGRGSAYFGVTFIQQFITTFDPVRVRIGLDPPDTSNNYR